MKPTRRPFIVERCSLASKGVRSFRQYAAEPDRIAELYAAADSLQNIPRESCGSMQDILFFNRRVAKQIRGIAERIEVKDAPGIAKKAPPPLTRIGRGARRAPAEGQLALCL